MSLFDAIKKATGQPVVYQEFRFRNHCGAKEWLRVYYEQGSDYWSVQWLVHGIGVLTGATGHGSEAKEAVLAEFEDRRERSAKTQEFFHDQARSVDA